MICEVCGRSWNPEDDPLYPVTQRIVSIIKSGRYPELAESLVIQCDECDLKLQAQEAEEFKSHFVFCDSGRG